MNKPPEEIVASAPEGTFWFGGPVDRSKMSLRIFGESVDPLEITKILGHEPTKGRKKGDRSVRGYVFKKGSWTLSAPESIGANIDYQVDWILSRLTKDLEIWKTTTEKYAVDLFAGLFLEARNRGIRLSPNTMQKLSSRGIELGFDIYSFEPDHSETDGAGGA